MTEKKPHLTYAQGALVMARMKAEIPANVDPAEKTSKAMQITSEVLAQPSLPATAGRTIRHYEESVYG